MEHIATNWNNMMNDPLGVIAIAVIALGILLIVTKLYSVAAKRHHARKRERRANGYGPTRRQEAEIRKLSKRGIKEIERELASLSS